MYKRIVLSTVLMLLAVPVFAGTKDAAPLLGVGAGVGLLFAVGLVVNEASLAGLYKSFLTIFNEALSAYQPQWGKFAMDIPSTTSVNTYAWMEAFPKMREWIGDREVKNLSAQTYDIKNKDYENTVGIKRSTIEDDQYGIFNPVFRSQAISAAALWDDLCFALLNFTGKSYDGKTFFATDHASGSNKLSGGTSPLSATSYAEAIKLLRSQKDSAGNPLFNGSETFTLIVPPALEQTARLILNADFVSVSSGSTQNNIWKGSASLLVTPKITTATNWFLVAEFMGLKPFIAQVRKKPEFTALVRPDDPVVFTKNEYHYGTYARGNAGYGLHQLAVGSVGA